MSIFEIFLIGVGLSMDAFAVAICKGLAMKTRLSRRKALIIGLWFGGFQALMPLMGFLIAGHFAHLVKHIDHWIAFILLAFLGIRMIKEARDGSCDLNPSTEVSTMLMLALATSIDALAVGITFAFLYVDIVPAVSLIGITTFIISITGVLFGHAIGQKIKSYAEFTGGFILVAIGFRILISHLIDHYL